MLKVCRETVVVNSKRKTIDHSRKVKPHSVIEVYLLIAKAKTRASRNLFRNGFMLTQGRTRLQATCIAYAAIINCTETSCIIKTPIQKLGLRYAFPIQAYRFYWNALKAEAKT